MATLLEAMLDQQAKNQAATLGNLQIAGGIQSMQANAEKQRRDAAYRQAVGALPENATEEQFLRAVAPFAGPDALMKAKQDAMNRQAQREQTAAQYAMTFQARQDALEEKKRQFDQSTADRAAKQAFEEEYKRQRLAMDQQMAGLNAQLKTMGLEIQRQGQQIQLQRLDQSQKDREEKDIEGQISKTAERMKDVQPVLVAARQLNDLLSRYTPETVPGIGYLKNTDTGKALLTQEGKDVSSSVKLVGNAILKAMSGTAVTAPEEVRQMAAQMADGRYGAKDFYVAWPKIVEWLNSQGQTATATLGDKARERYIQRTGLDISPVQPRYKVTYSPNNELTLQDTFAPQKGALPAPPPGFKVNQ